MADDPKGGYFASLPPDVFATALNALYNLAIKGIPDYAANPAPAVASQQVADLALRALQALRALTDEEHSGARSTIPVQPLDVVVKLVELNDTLKKFSAVGAVAASQDIANLTTKLNEFKRFWDTGLWV
jgi:hypothetical protein